VDSKKEALAAAILAISLAVGLGTVSYSLFSETPVPAQSARIDLFSERNGVPSISFLPEDIVLVEAELSYRNASVAGTPVTFDVQTPNNTEFFYPPETVTTNSDGIANVTFQIPWPSGVQFTSLGSWHISAASEVYGQALNATANFECSLLQPIIDVFTQEGGVGPNMPGGNFLLDGTVVLYAEVRDELNHTVPNQFVAFEIRGPNGTDITSTNTTDSSGITTEIFRPAYVGIFEVYVTTSYYSTVLIDTLTFTVT
jgi:hypothetical protein